MRQLLMMMGLAAAIALPAGAETPTPGLFRVAGVQTKLNIRAEPALEAAILGALAPDAADVEVVAVDPTGGWGRINLGEGTGWVSLDFLEAQGGPWAANALPEHLRCFGTEPFWDIRRDGDALIRGGLGETDRPLRIDSVTGAAGSTSRVVVARDKEGAVTLGIAPEQCSDGMSDRAFGLGARLSEGDQPALIGCCSVAP